MTVIYTDGSLRTDRKRRFGAYGYIITNGKNQSMGMGCVPVWETTISRMELMAIIAGIQHVLAIRKKTKETGDVTVHSDSRYAMNCCNVWISQWERDGFVTRKGSPVANRDLMETISSLKRKLAFRVLHVRAHTSSRDARSRRNQEVDHMVTNMTYLMKTGKILPPKERKAGP